MSRIPVGLTNSATMSHVPLAALGYALRRAGILDGLDEVKYGIKASSHTPQEKLMEGLVLVLAGGRATSQADLLLRPNRGLAKAWGQEQFAQQATLARAFDALENTSVEQMSVALDQIVREQSRACAHDFRTGPLVLDGDLTGLPASRHAQGSQKGYFAGEKTESVVRWRG
jgi:hypothetical protein